MNGSVKFEKDGHIVGPPKSHKREGWGAFQPIKGRDWGKTLRGS